MIDKLKEAITPRNNFYEEMYAYSHIKFMY